MNKIYIVGAYHELIELAQDNGYEIAGLIDNDKTGFYMGIKIIGRDDDMEKINVKYPLIISPHQPNIRNRLYLYYVKKKFEFISIISGQSKVSAYSTIGNGVVVQSGVNISAAVILNNFARVNTNANIMHDSSVGEFSTIAPNAVILGYIKVGKFCYIGANSTILPYLTIGDNSIIGAGSVVTKDIPPNSVYAGNPAKFLRENR